MGPDLTTKQKMEAIGAIDFDVCLCLSTGGKWFLSCAIEVGGDGLLSCNTQWAATPEEAIDAWWLANCENLPPDKYLYCRGKRFRWNYGWIDEPQSDTATAPGGA